MLALALLFFGLALALLFGLALALLMPPPPPPLSLLRCLPHTSYLGFFAAFCSNVFPCFGEIIYLYYAYNTTTYIDQQTVVPSFWFRWWRPGFLIAGILYDVGMLAYSIYMEDIFTVLLAVRITIGLYQVSDQIWMIKRWVPFFVEKEKRRFLFVRVYLIGCVWFLMVGCTTWTNSWQNENDIFANVYYISLIAIYFSCGLWYLIRGGIDCFVKYRFHCGRNLFGLLAFSGMILGIVGLIIGDGGGNNLVETLNYHSAFVMIYFVLECAVVVIVHRFMVVYEELSWKCPSPINEPPSNEPPSTHGFSDKSTTFEAISGIISNSNKVLCDVDVPSSSIEGARTGSIPQVTVVAAATLPTNHNDITMDDTKPSNDEGRMVVEDGKQEGDLEAAHGLVSQPASASVGDEPSVTSPRVHTRTGSIDVSYQAQRRFALAFDGITRRSSLLRSSILTHHIMMVKVKRHELVCREVDKFFTVLYQMVLWETIIWLTQIFLTLYLQSVNIPTLPGQKGYYCHTPLENTANSAQFVNDLVFARI